MKLDDKAAALCRTRLENLKRFAAACGHHALRDLLQEHADSNLEWLDAEGEPLGDVERYLVARETYYDGQQDEADVEPAGDLEFAAKGLVEDHAFQEPRGSDYSYRCTVVDLDAGREVKWEEVRYVTFKE